MFVPDVIPGGCFNIEMLSYQCRNSHYVDKKVSHLIFVIENTQKESLYIETG